MFHPRFRAANPGMNVVDSESRVKDVRKCARSVIDPGAPLPLDVLKRSTTQSNLKKIKAEQINSSKQQRHILISKGRHGQSEARRPQLAHKIAICPSLSICVPLNQTIYTPTKKLDKNLENF